MRQNTQPPALRPTGVDPVPLPCKPGTSRAVLDQLRAEDHADAPISPTAIRHAHDSRTWVPSLRSIPVLVGDIDTVLADIHNVLTQAPALRHEEPIAELLSRITTMLGQEVTA